MMMSHPKEAAEVEGGETDSSLQEALNEAVQIKIDASFIHEY